MLISRQLTLDRIALDIKGNTMEDVLVELADLVIQTVDGLDSAYVRQLLIEREQRLSTAVGCGVALPHCTTTKVIVPQLAIGINRAGIEADAPDNKPVHIFFVIVSPEENPEVHLDVLTAAAKLFTSHEVRESLQNALDSTEVLKTIELAEHKLNE